MAKETVQLNLPRETLDSAMLRSMFGATRDLAGLQGSDYMLQDSFLQGLQEPSDPAVPTLPDSKLGIYSDLTQEPDERLRFIWFDDGVGDTLSAQGANEDLRARIEFAKVVDKFYFFGALSLHQLATGRRVHREVYIDATGFKSGVHEASENSIAEFAGQIGVHSLWNHVPAGDRGIKYETQFTGYPGKPLARDIASSLRRLRASRP